MKQIHPLKYSVHTRLREFHLKRLLQNYASGRLLDVGCGLGYLTEVLGEGFIEVGIEYDINALSFNRSRGIRNMVQGDVTKLPFMYESVDVIICSEVLEHLPDGLDERVLHEMASVLKPGGLLLITVPSLEGLRAESILRNLGHDDPAGGEYHYRIGYAWHELKAMLNRNPLLKLRKRRYAMFLFSELFMDLLKWVYFKKGKLKEHSDLIEMNESSLFNAYRLLFPLLYFCFVCEDILLASFFKGHILILALEKK